MRTEPLKLLDLFSGIGGFSLGLERTGEARARAQACARWAGRGDDGLPAWVDRVAALGNAVVPQIPELIGRAILQTLEAA